MRWRSGGRARKDLDDLDAHVGNIQEDSAQIRTVLPSLQPHHPDTATLLGLVNVVFIEMGEPMDSLDNVLQAFRVVNEPLGLNISLSKMTVPAAGEVERIRRLSLENEVRLRLAISLNVGNDEIRGEIVPINNIASRA